MDSRGCKSLHEFDDEENENTESVIVEEDDSDTEGEILL